MFIPSSYKPGKKLSPKWFTSQCATAVTHKNHRFNQWKLHQTLQSRALFVQACNICSKPINHAKFSLIKCINNKIASCQTGSRSFWSLAKLVSQNLCHSSFPPLKTTLAHIHALLPLNLTFLIPILMTKISNLLSTPHPPSQCPLLTSLHTKSGKSFFS